MTTVKDLKKWLSQFPDETIVQFGIQQEPSNYESYGPVVFKNTELTDSEYGEGWEFIDFEGNQFVKEEHPKYNKKYLRLGESS